MLFKKNTETLNIIHNFSSKCMYEQSVTYMLSLKSHTIDKSNFKHINVPVSRLIDTTMQSDKMLYTEPLSLIHSSSYQGVLVISVLEDFLKVQLIAHPTHWHRLGQGGFMHWAAYLHILWLAKHGFICSPIFSFLLLWCWWPRIRFAHISD